MGEMNIAVFADLHGRILLCFLLCARWEQETGERIGAVLQAGDLGAYPSEAGMDRATLRHGRLDATEFGFATDFTSNHEDVARALERTQCPLIFVRGNHEDHVWLDTLERQSDGPLFPIDAYRRVFCLKTGILYTLGTGAESLVVLGIGRVGPPIGEPEVEKPKYIQDYEIERLYDLDELSLDVLLTHDVPLHGIEAHPGMEEIRLLLDAYTPRYHFYGHTEEPFQERVDRNGVTSSCRMADLSWHHGTQGHLPPGVMGMLRWRSRNDSLFEVVDAPWLDDYRVWNWRMHV
ncbi:MAG TPA: metallophosphoesterase [Ktedonobacterales bacterium]